MAAIIRRAGQFNHGAHDRVFLEEMMTDVFAPTMTPHSQRYLATLRAETTKTLAESAQTVRARIAELLKDLEAQSGSHFGKKLNQRLEAQCTRAVAQLETKLETLVDKANSTADRAYQNVAKQLIESWANRPSERRWQRAFASGPSMRLRKTLASRVSEVPRCSSAPPLVHSSTASVGSQRDWGSELFNDLAKEARAFVENELSAVQASMERAKNGTARSSHRKRRSSRHCSHGCARAVDASRRSRRRC